MSPGETTTQEQLDEQIQPLKVADHQQS